jgi:hypothetical protein
MPTVLQTVHHSLLVCVIPKFVFAWPLFPCHNQDYAFHYLPSDVEMFRHDPVVDRPQISLPYCPAESKLYCERSRQASTSVIRTQTECSVAKSLAVVRTREDALDISSLVVESDTLDGGLLILLACLC